MPVLKALRAGARNILVVNIVNGVLWMLDRVEANVEVGRRDESTSAPRSDVSPKK